MIAMMISITLGSLSFVISSLRSSIVSLRFSNANSSGEKSSGVVLLGLMRWVIPMMKGCTRLLSALRRWLGSKLSNL